ncbi:NADP-dependent oxidoreductase [Streptacidiphilus sp. EB103A]|uniref:NADP-dependent oxidoreductase n=1 Tax=Streptacidiphilus sp. EB103A TaxID=3156275 RepID=UPI003514E580
MPKAVRFKQYGGIEVLDVVEAEKPEPAAGQVLVAVRAAGINPGEAMIRSGALHARWPATFPSGQGSDLAGTVEAVGPGVSGFAVGDEVLGFTDDRASHAEFVLVPAGQLTRRPDGVPVEAAGALFVAGTTAYAAVRAVSVTPGDVVVVSGAAGGVGSLAVQLARNAGATVIGLAGPANHDWLREHGVVPVAYGEGVADRIKKATGGHVDAFIDTYGAGYVRLAIDLGVAPERIDTVIDFAAAEEFGVRTDGSGTAASALVLAELADLIDRGRLEVPITHTYALTEVRDAYRELERRHTRGKIVLLPQP